MMRLDHASGLALKRRVLARMRTGGVGPEKMKRAEQLTFPGRPWECILGTSTKVEKNRRVGLLTKVVYLAPARESVAYGGRNL
jgi:hypothetical protein